MGKNKTNQDKIKSGETGKLEDKADLNSQNPPKPKLYFILILLLLPIFFIVFLEIGLSVIDYGEDYSQWVEITDERLVLNPIIAKKYFSNIKSIPNSNHDTFYKVKRENSYRIFVLGESSAAGFPFSPNGSFSRYLQDKLDLYYPNRLIEVVNLGMSAINTYTLVDLMPGVIEQKPDLIIIYTGHNEYYGALGVGSLESMVNSDFLIKASLFFRKFKTYQFINDIIDEIFSLLTKKEIDKESESTLMAQVVKDKLIEFGGDKYKSGIEQFKKNIESILKSASANKIPVIIGTLTSNIKDQSPFIAGTNNKKESADSIFVKAGNEFEKGNYPAADSLFRLAKDLDALRFRAPEEINRAINSIGSKYNSRVVNIDSIFCSRSPGNIVGDNLMVDHLHPSLSGYLLMGKSFFDEVILFLEKTESDINYIETTAAANFSFTKLDSAIAEFRILNLKNDWPFKQERDQNFLRSIHLHSYADSLAYMVAFENYSWESAHTRLAERYYQQNNFREYGIEMRALFSQYTFKLSYADKAIFGFIKSGDYDSAYLLLIRRNKIESDDFSLKWLGSIYLMRGKYQEAIEFLKRSTGINSGDPQAFFNLALAYYNLNLLNEAYNAISKCLSINLDYPNAFSLSEQIKNKREF